MKIEAGKTYSVMSEAEIAKRWPLRCERYGTPGLAWYEEWLNCCYGGSKRQVTVLSLTSPAICFVEGRLYIPTCILVPLVDLVDRVDRAVRCRL